MKNIPFILIAITICSCDTIYSLTEYNTGNEYVMEQINGTNIKIKTSTINNRSFVFSLRFTTSDSVIINTDGISIVMHGQSVEYRKRDGGRSFRDPTITIGPGESRNLSYFWPMSSEAKKGDKIMVSGANYVITGDKTYDLPEYVFVVDDLP